jgi:hypothetical protein
MVFKEYLKKGYFKSDFSKPFYFKSASILMYLLDIVAIVIYNKGTGFNYDKEPFYS